MSKVTIQRVKIKELPINEVTSHSVFQPHKIKDKDGNLLFNDKGIFSTKIFGKFGKCSCGARTKPGICQYCGTRVLNKRRVPNFYISFKGMLDIPYLQIDIPDFADYQLVDDILNYRGFLYDGEYVEFNLTTLNLTDFDKDKVLIGKDAIFYLGGTEEWYNAQVHDKLSIPHTSLRKITIQRGSYFLGNLNTIFVDILKQKKAIQNILNTQETVVDVFHELDAKRIILAKIHEVYDGLFDMLVKGKKSILAREIIGQGVTGCIRAVITNNFDISEDVALLGKYFIKTLYPKLFDKFTNTNGITDITALNKYLRDNEYYILINRQPTIGALSILGMIPVFSDKEEDKYVMQLNPIITCGLGGDYDGDCLAAIALYTKAACMEAKSLLPSVNYIEGSNGSIRNCIPEDLQYTMQKLYDEGKGNEIDRLLM